MNEIAADLGLSMRSLAQFARYDAVLKEALSFAHDCALAYWESRARKALTKAVPKQGPECNKRTRRKWRQRYRERFNERLWIDTMERRFPREYGRKGDVAAPAVARPAISREIVRPTN